MFVSLFKNELSLTDVDLQPIPGSLPHGAQPASGGVSMGLVGPNGAGEFTLLNVIFGIGA